jgi:osmoprotectant transport system substrate-binding protein
MGCTRKGISFFIGRVMALLGFRTRAYQNDLAAEAGALTAEATASALCWIHSRMRRLLCLVLAGLAVTAACGRRAQPVIVGSKNDMEGNLLGEIIAQHLENRLGGNVQRQLALGNTAVAYQALVTGQVSLYPEYTGLIETEILKETPSKDPVVLVERTRSEMRRLAQAELLDSLGFDARSVMVVAAANVPRDGTLSGAAAAPTKWKIGVSFEFQDRPDGIPALNEYQLPLGAAIRGMDPKDLFPAMQKGELNMAAATATDGHLALETWKALTDDKNVFTPQLACVLVRQDALAREPRLRAALQELSGKFSIAIMRKYSAQMEIQRRPAAQAAAAALAEAGLQ